MNELVTDGWHIQGLMERGGALIITAIRPDVPPEILAAMAAMQPRTPQTRTPRKDPGTAEDVVYNYQELGTSHSIPCTLKEAVAYFEEHAAPWKGLADGPAPDILPISIVVMHVTSYELADIPELKTRT